MENEKYVDEGWKESVIKEKETTQPSDPKPEPQTNADEMRHGAEEEELSEVNFIGYITSLAYQTMIFLGEVPNSIDNKIIKNLQQAKLLIDTLVMLKEKTKGNLDEQEDKALDQLVYELQMKFVDISNQKES